MLVCTAVCKAQGFERQDGENTGHDVEDDAAEKCESYSCYQTYACTA